MNSGRGGPEKQSHQKWASPQCRSCRVSCSGRAHQHRGEAARSGIGPYWYCAQTNTVLRSIVCPSAIFRVPSLLLRPRRPFSHDRGTSRMDGADCPLHVHFQRLNCLFPEYSYRSFRLSRRGSLRTGSPAASGLFFPSLPSLLCSPLPVGPPASLTPRLRYSPRCTRRVSRCPGPRCSRLRPCF
jgi:hypothetical protein